MYPVTVTKFAQFYVFILTLFGCSELSSCIDSNIGMKFTEVPESTVVPPGDLVFFSCKTNLGKGKFLTH